MSSANQVQEQIYGLVKSEHWAQLVVLCEDFELDVRNIRNRCYETWRVFAEKSATEED